MAIYKAGVIGAGTMGAGIAQVISFAGIPVFLKDVNEEALERGLATIRSFYETRVAKKRMTQEEMDEKMALVTPITDYEPLSEADLVVEAVPELLNLKFDIFKELDRVCSEGAILATNTSALSISQIAASTSRPGKVIGMHFFYPAPIMKLLEIIPGLQTDADTVEEIVALAEDLKKIPVTVQECPGFLVNRLLMPYLNEAVLCLQEGAASIQEIDAAMREHGWPMGPFTLIDALGLDVCAEAGKVLWEGYGERMQPAELWVELESLGRVGKKNGKGFYDYNGEGTAATDMDDELKAAIKAAQEKSGRSGTSFSPERLMSLVINEAVLSLQEGISSPTEIEMGVLAGLGYARSRGGLLHTADKLGVDVLVDTLDKFTQELGFRFHPAHKLRTMKAAGLLGEKTGQGFFSYAPVEA